MRRIRLMAALVFVSGILFQAAVCEAANRIIRLEGSGISEETFNRIEQRIESDIANGFTSAQLVVRRHGRLVYQNAWGEGKLLYEGWEKA
ncbi:MAG: hypothetical protein K6F62_04520 [Schwartzia sp.]|nr:hypothetical protein [Schwartzia sp. (in: firmicutes)]